MARSEIFVVSSGRTLEIAKQLRVQFNENYCKVHLWAEESKGGLGKSILVNLLDATKKYDFAVVILSKDDVLVTTGDAPRLKARDNCIFEAGLFMSAIGYDRCILLTSVAENDLPSDLGGVICQPFSEPDGLNLTDPTACRDAIVNAVTWIENRVRELGPIRDRPLSQEKLLERERRKIDGGELLMDQVIVAAVEPLDLDYSYDGVQQVRKNIDKGNIRYLFFVQGKPYNADKICHLLQLLLLGDNLKPSDLDDWPGLLGKIRNNASQIKQDLERLCGMMKIYFLQEGPALEYCIHNAGSTGHAKIYLKRGKEYYPWVSGPTAYDIAEELRKARGAFTLKAPMFYGADGFKINEGEFFNSLKSAVETYFPGIEEDVIKLFLDGPNAK